MTVLLWLSSVTMPEANEEPSREHETTQANSAICPCDEKPGVQVPDPSAVASGEPVEDVSS